MRPLFARLSEETVHIYALVLASAGISCQIQHKGRFWTITVSPHHRRPAIKAVALYLIENPAQTSRRRYAALPGVRTYSAVYISTIIALIHWAVLPGYEHQVFVDTFGADAGKIMVGDIYRCITALLLHKDWPHVVNNMAGLALFGTVTASICGWGMGWFMILLSGVAGNMATALWYRQGHIAIGASTAVFGALGLCIALNLWRHARTHRPSWRMWLPLAGGLALLGFLGGSPHSDVMAHLSGFGFGLVIGGVYGRLCQCPPGMAFQLVAALAGSGLVVASWIYGMYAGG